MTDRLKEIEEREQKATTGPWHGQNWVVRMDTAQGLTQYMKNNDFIAHSREDIPYLLERLRDAENKMREMAVDPESDALLDEYNAKYRGEE
jgi:hypothetical protein